MVKRVNDYGELHGPVTHLVVIAREGAPEVTEFRSEEDALGFYEDAQAQWSEAYLCEVKRIGARILGERGMLAPPEAEFPCDACGAVVRMTARPGRAVEVVVGGWMPIPDDFERFECTGCGEVYTDMLVAERLHLRLLADLWREKERLARAAAPCETHRPTATMSDRSGHYRWCFDCGAIEGPDGWKLPRRLVSEAP